MFNYSYTDMSLVDAKELVVNLDGVCAVAKRLAPESAVGVVFGLHRKTNGVLSGGQRGGGKVISYL